VIGMIGRQVVIKHVSPADQPLPRKSRYPFRRHGSLATAQGKAGHEAGRSLPTLNRGLGKGWTF